MSNDDLCLQGGAGYPAATPNQAPSSSSSMQPAAPAGGPDDALGGPPPIPPFFSPYSDGLPPTAQRITCSALTQVVVNEGREEAARKARQHHLAVDPANAPTLAELMTRDDEAQHNLKDRYKEFRQGSPKAIALRLLAPRAGRSYEFEKVETPYTNQKGKISTGKKCGAPGCEYRNHQDHGRHMAEKHVKDPVKALFCPDGDVICEKGYYDTSRASELKNHIKGHEKRNKAAQEKGRGNQDGPAQ